MSESWTLYVAVAGKKGRGAWSYRLVPDKGAFQDGTGTAPLDSVYRLRLHALVEGLAVLPDGAAVNVLTTDPNTIELVERWIPRWRAEDFRKKPEDLDLIERLLPSLDRLSVSLEHLRSRTGDHHAKDCSLHAKEAGNALPEPDPVDVDTAVQVRDDVEVVAWTDGGSRKNPGPSGWGCVLVHLPTGTTLLKRGGEAVATNNRMELTAIAEALDSFTRRTRIEIRADSTFSISACSQWMTGWKRRGWRKPDGEEPANLDVLQRLDGLLQRHQVVFTWVKGHAGEPGNTLADGLCNDAIDDVLAERDPTHEVRSDQPPFGISVGRASS